MRHLHCTAGLAILGAGILTALGAAPAATPTTQPDMKDALALATQYDKFAHPSGEGTWEKGDILPTAKKEDAAAWTAAGGTLNVDKDGLHLSGNLNEGCYATLAKKTFKGPIGIRYEAQCPLTAEPCDLSVRFGPADKSAIAFAFGGWANNEDFIILGAKHETGVNAPLITPGQWYTVEVKITPELVTASVDGKVICTQKLPQPLTDASEHNLSLYVWGTMGDFKNVQLLKYVPPQPANATWEGAMGKTTKEDLQALAVKMGTMLGSDSFAARDQAESALFMLRPFSDPVVQAGLTSKDMEVKIRSQRLASKMGIATEDAPADKGPATPAPPADNAADDVMGN